MNIEPHILLTVFLLSRVTPIVDFQWLNRFVGPSPLVASMLVTLFTSGQRKIAGWIKSTLICQTLTLYYSREYTQRTRTEEVAGQFERDELSWIPMGVE